MNFPMMGTARLKWGLLCNLLPVFGRWLALGELIHVGKHAAWGNGWCELREGDQRYVFSDVRRIAETSTRCSL